MDESRKKLFDAVSTKYDIGTFDDFNVKMDNPESRKKFYDAVSKDLDIGDFDTFESKIVKKKGTSESPTQVSPSESGGSSSDGITTYGGEKADSLLSEAEKVSQPEDLISQISKLPGGLEWAKNQQDVPPELNAEKFHNTVEKAKPIKTSYIGGAVKEFNEGLAENFRLLGGVADKILNIIPGMSIASQIGAVPPNPFNGVADLIQKSSEGNAPIPDNLVGNVVGGISRMGSDLIGMAVSPEIKTNEMLAKWGMTTFPKVAEYLAVKEGTAAALNTEEKTPVQQIVDPITGVVQGFASGMALEALGKSTAPLAKGIAGKLFPANKIGYKGVQTAVRSIGDAIGFGGLTAAEDFIRTGKVDPKNIASGAGMGLAFGLAGGLFSRGIDNVVAKSSKDIQTIMDNPKSATELKSEADKLANDVQETTRPYFDIKFNDGVYDVLRNGKPWARTESSQHAQELINTELLAPKTNDVSPQDKNINLMSAVAIDNAAVTKATVEDMVERPQEYINVIQQSELPEQAKQELTDKVNEVVAANDPVAKEAKPVVDEINTTLKQVDNINNNKAISEVEKGIKTKPLQEKVEELKTKVEEIYNKPKPEVKPEEQPQKIVKEGELPELDDLLVNGNKIKGEGGKELSVSIIKEGIQKRLLLIDNEGKEVGGGIPLDENGRITDQYIRDYLEYLRYTNKKESPVEPKAEKPVEELPPEPLKEPEVAGEELPAEGKESPTAKTVPEKVQEPVTPKEVKGKVVEPNPKVKTDAETVAKELGYDDADVKIYNAVKDLPEEDRVDAVINLVDNVRDESDVESTQKRIDDNFEKLTELDDQVKALEENKDQAWQPKKTRDARIAKLRKQIADIEKTQKLYQGFLDEQMAKPVGEFDKWKYTGEEDIERINDLVDRVNGRLETRKGVAEGTDLFPEMANIPEFKAKVKKIKTVDKTITDETIRRVADQDPKELEQSAKDIERKAESGKTADLEEAVRKADEIIGESTIEKKTPILDDYRARQDKLDRTEQTDISKLKEGDYIAVPRSEKTSGVTGFVKKVNPKNVIIETIYGGYGDSDVQPMEITVKKVDIAKYLTPKVEQPTVEPPVSEPPQKEGLPETKETTNKEGEPNATNQIIEQGSGVGEHQRVPQGENLPENKEEVRKSESGQTGNSSSPGAEKEVPKRELKAKELESEKEDLLRQWKEKRAGQGKTTKMGIDLDKDEEAILLKLAKNYGERKINDLATLAENIYNDIKDFINVTKEDVKNWLQERGIGGQETVKPEELNLIAANALADAVASEKFGVQAVQAMIDALPKGDNAKEILNNVLKNIDTKKLEENRQRILEGNTKISVEMQAQSAVDMALIKAKDIELRIKKQKAIDEGADGKTLSGIDEEILKNDAVYKDSYLANRMLGTEWGQLGQFRGALNAVTDKFNIVDMEAEYKAKNDIKGDLTEEQKQYIKEHYEGIKDAEANLEKIKQQDAEILRLKEEKENQQKINEGLNKIIEDYKNKSGKSKEKTKDKVARIDAKINKAKQSLKSLTYGRATSMGVLDPAIYKALGDIISGKVEKFYEETKGKIELKKLLDETLKEAQEYMPELTKTDIEDALSGNYKKPKQTKSDLTKAKEDLKKETKLRRDNPDVDFKDDDTLEDIQDKVAKQKEKVKAEKKLGRKKEKISKEEEKSKYEREKKNKEILKRRYRQIQQVEADIQNKRFEKEEPKVFRKSDAVIEAERVLEKRKAQWRAERKADMMKKRPLVEKVADIANEFIRAFNLSFAGTIIKLGGVVAHNLLTKVPRTLVQKGVVQLIPKEIRKYGGYWGDVELKSLADYYVNHIKVFRIETLKRVFGKEFQDPTHELSSDLAAYPAFKFLNYPGKTHQLIKEFIRSPELKFSESAQIYQALKSYTEAESKLKNTNLSAEERQKWEEQKEDFDVSNPNVMQRISDQAYADASYQILMNNKKLGGMVKNAFGGHSKNAVIRTLQKVLWRSQNTIITVPINYFSRYLYQKYGALIKTMIGDYKSDSKQHVPGIFELFGKRLFDKDAFSDVNLPPEIKSEICKNVVNGSYTAMAMGIALMTYKNITYDRDKKQYNIYGIPITEKVMHLPLMDVILSYATTFNEIENTQGEKAAKDYIAISLKNDYRQFKNMPFYNQLTYGYLSNVIDATQNLARGTALKAWDEGEKGIGKLISTYTAPPGFVREYAKKIDERIQGGQHLDPETIGEMIKKDWPWASLSVATKEEKNLGTYEKMVKDHIKQEGIKKVTDDLRKAVKGGQIHPDEARDLLWNAFDDKMNEVYDTLTPKQQSVVKKYKSLPKGMERKFYNNLDTADRKLIDTADWRREDSIWNEFKNKDTAVFDKDQVKWFVDKFHELDSIEKAKTAKQDSIKKAKRVYNH